VARAGGLLGPHHMDVVRLQRAMFLGMLPKHIDILRLQQPASSVSAYGCDWAAMRRCMLVRGWLVRVLGLLCQWSLPVDHCSVAESSAPFVLLASIRWLCNPVCSICRACVLSLPKPACRIDASKAGRWCCTCLLSPFQPRADLSRVRGFLFVRCLSKAEHGDGIFFFRSATAAGCRWCVCLWHACMAGCVPTPVMLCYQNGVTSRAPRYRLCLLLCPQPTVRLFCPQLL
jgi:hypothetical protein